MCYYEEPAPPPTKLLVVRTQRDGLANAFSDWEIILVLANIPKRQYDIVVMGSDLYNDKEWLWYHKTLKKAAKHDIIWTA